MDPFGSELGAKLGQLRPNLAPTSANLGQSELKMNPKCPKVTPKWLQVDNVRAVLASSAISLRQNSHLEFLSHLFPVWPGGMRVALE